MTKLSVLVVGCEHSGSRWVAHLLSIHPEVDATHVSSPTAGRLPLPELLESLRDGNFHCAVLVYRDSSAIRASQIRGGSFNKVLKRAKSDPSNPEFFFLQQDLVDTWTATARQIIGVCDSIGVPWAPASYELLVLDRRIGLVPLFERLGLSNQEYDYFEADHPDRGIVVGMDTGKSSRTVDGNAKYFVMPTLRAASQRWFIELGRFGTRLLRPFVPQRTRSWLRGVQSDRARSTER